MATIKPDTSIVVSRQLPEFIRSDYQTFVAFLEAYYEFIGQDQKRNLEDLKDLDRTLDSFVASIKNELDFAGKNYDGIDQRFLLQRIKDIYLAKGSEASYKLLFKLLFNKESSIYYPGQYLLKPSDGRWKQDVSVYVETQSGDPYVGVGKEAEIVTNTKKVKALVGRVRATPYPGIVEVFLEKPPYGDIERGSIIQFDGWYGIIRESTVSYKISQGGAGFRLGQIFEITSGLGTGTKIKVSAVSTTGAVESIQIIKFGYGFVSNFIQTLNAKDLVVEAFAPYEDFTNGFVDGGFIVKPIYYEDGYTDSTYVGEVIREFYNNAQVPEETKGDVAIIEFFIGSKMKYPGFFETNNGFLSDTIYLQDSKYYQLFSYVIKINEQLENYKEFIKRYLHPAGMALFAEYEITNEFSLTKSIEVIIASFRGIIAELVTVFDGDVSINISKIISETISASELASITFSTSFSESTSATETKEITLGKNITETVSLVDAALRSITKDLADVATITEADTFSITKPLSESITLTDSLIVGLNSTKYINDTQSVADTGGTIVKNYYTSSDYWESTYSVGATTF